MEPAPTLRRKRIGGPVVVAVALALAACGNNAGPRDERPARASAGTPASGVQSEVPELLEGTWQATIDPSRLVGAPAGLEQERSAWKLKFRNTGGENDGPSMLLSNEQFGDTVHSVSLSGEAITLQSDTECTRFAYVEIDTEKVQINSTEKGCPRTLISSVLQRPWRLVHGGPSRREPTTAEGSAASRKAFVSCARRRDELGVIVGFRDGRAVPEPGQDVGGAKVDTRVSAPQAIPELLEEGGQYVGLRAGAGPDVDIFFFGGRIFDQSPSYSPLGRVIDEAVKTGIVSTNAGDYSGLAGDQAFVTVRLEGGPPGWDDDSGAYRVARALKHLVPCFRRAVRATDRLIPAPGPFAGVWKTDPITVGDMIRTLREHGLARWAGRFAKHAPIGRKPTVLILEIDTRIADYPYDWHLFAEADSRSTLIDYRAQADDAGRQHLQYERHGDRLVVSREGESNAYRWSVDGRRLTLTWEKTTYPPHLGIPEEVFQRALYMTAVFKRAG